MVRNQSQNQIILIKANLQKSKRILKDLAALAASYSIAKDEEKTLIESSSPGLIDQLVLLNESVTPVIKEIQISLKKIVKEKAKPKITERIVTATGPVYIDKKSKARFLHDLGIEKKMLKKIKMKKIIKEKEKVEVKLIKPSFIASFSNKIFYNTSIKLSKTNFFKSVKKDLRKANMAYMLSTYISMILFFTFLVFILSLAAFILPVTIWVKILIVVILPIITFFLVLSYPSSVVSSTKRKINAELPFAISHMAAIASSKIEPSRIFSIMALAKEYEAVGAEIRKIVNQINIYGYDLSTALKNVSKTTPSRKFADLLNGMATTITTGGNLTLYLNEKAKNTLLDYKLSRERYSTVIGMYSDIYTALLIAAPLIFMLLLAIVSVMGTTFLGMSVSAIANIGIVIIALLNIIFLLFLRFTQPEA